MFELVMKAVYETFGMVSVSAGVSFALGIPLALLLHLTAPEGLKPHRWLHQGLGVLINVFRSIPYIILTILILPVTKILVGTSIGMWGAIVPLSFAGILLVARMAEEAFRQLPVGLVEVGLAAGASTGQILCSIILSESLPALIGGGTTVLINLLGFSAMAGTVGGGGLGDLAIRYGYQRYNLPLLFIIVGILVVFVQVLQMTGDILTRKLRK